MSSPGETRFRRGTFEDSRAVFEVFLESVQDLGRRTGVMAITGGDDPLVIPRLWETRRSLFEHLAATADEFWVAERGGQIAGYARSIARAGCASSRSSLSARPPSPAGWDASSWRGPFLPELDAVRS